MVGYFILHSGFEGHSSYLNIDMSHSICELLDGMGLLLMSGFLDRFLLPLNQSHFMEVLCNLLKTFPRFSFEMDNLTLLISTSYLTLLILCPSAARTCYEKQASLSSVDSMLSTYLQRGQLAWRLSQL